jgi:hypothetical protein
MSRRRVEELPIEGSEAVGVGIPAIESGAGEAGLASFAPGVGALGLVVE